MLRLVPMSKRSIHKATALNGFFQDPPKLPSKYDSDPFLQSVMKRYLPPKIYDEVKGDLSRFGEKCSGELKELGDLAEANPPKVEHFDTWGRRVDKLITSEGWRKLHDVAAEEGLVAIAYERKYKEHSRIYMFAKNYLFTGTTAVYGCPLAMTDGAARLIEVYGNDSMKSDQYKKLISRDPATFWTSGQWMTERPGGSDVGNTETIATKDKDGQWNISGFKWFSSATDADMTMLLARVVDEQGNYTEGSRGLSLFFARIKDDHAHSKLNGVRIHRLKNKLGTKALPTAELELDNMKGVMVGAEGRGVASIATILNITRIHNAISSCGAMRTAMMLVQDFALKRRAFGKLIHEHPLHIQTLASMELQTRTATELTFFTVHLLGKAECGTASPTDLALLRMLTPLVKLYTAKQSVSVVSEAMEAMGGQGYIEDTGLARIFRDTQVGTIWEGTTNVLSLDLIRVLKGSPESLKAFEEAVKVRVDRGKAVKELEQQIADINKAMEVLRTYLTASFQKGLMESGARDLAYTMTRVFMASLMLDIAVQSRDPVDILVVKRWCQAGLVSYSTVFPAHSEVNAEDYRLAMGKSKL